MGLFRRIDLKVLGRGLHIRAANGQLKISAGETVEVSNTLFLVGIALSKTHPVFAEYLNPEHNVQSPTVLVGDVHFYAMVACRHSRAASTASLGRKVRRQKQEDDEDDSGSCEPKLPFGFDDFKRRHEGDLSLIRIWRRNQWAAFYTKRPSPIYGKDDMPD